MRLKHHLIIIFLSCICIVPLYAQGQIPIDSIVRSTIDKAEYYRKTEKDYNKAIDTLTSQLDKLLLLGADSTQLVDLFHKIGVNYYRKEQYQKALSYLQQTAILRGKKNNGQITISTIKTDYALSRVHLNMFQTDQADQHLELAIRGMEGLITTNQSKDTLRLMRYYNTAMLLNLDRRDTRQVEMYWKKSFDFFSKEPIIYALEILNLYKERGVYYYLQQDYQLAVNDFKRVVEMSEKYKEFLDVFTVIGAYSDLAYGEIKIGDLQNSYVHANKALKLIQEIDVDSSGNTKIGIAQRRGVIYSNLLELANLSRDPNFQDYYNKSLENLQKGYQTTYNPYIADTYSRMAAIHLSNANTKEAIHQNSLAIHTMVPSFEAKDDFEILDIEAHSVGDKLKLLPILSQKSTIFFEAYQENKNETYLQTAYQNYYAVDQLITQIRHKQKAEGSQFDLIKQTYPIYEEAIKTALALYELTTDERYLLGAYHFVARNKAMILLDNKQANLAKIEAAIPSSILETEAEIQRAIYQLEAIIYQQGKEVAINYEDSLFSLKRTQEKLQQQLENDYPDYYQQKYKVATVISPKKIQSQLAEGSTLIEYFVGDEVVVGFGISKGSVKYFIKDRTPDFDRHSNMLRQLVWDTKEKKQTFQAASHWMYQYLLEELLDPNSNALVIIPDGALMEISFDILSSQKDKVHYLLEDYAVSYAYSSQLLKVNRQPKEVDIFAGFGLEYDDYTLEALTQETGIQRTVAMNDLVRNLGKLIYSDDEISEIATLLEGKQWLNEAATLEKVKEEMEHYSILHFAAHGIVDKVYPLNSALVLTKEEGKNNLLKASDIRLMDLNADMVVLSACNTAAGAVEKGEGVRSLARAFSEAGCPSMVASLWNASDRSTKEILVSFYAYLQAGKSKDVAMRLAKLDYLKQAPPVYKQPFYWSHLSVIGDKSELSALSKMDNMRWLYIVGGVGVLLAIGWGVARRLRA